MSHSHITAILNQTDSFPVLPATVNRVIEITGIPESSANDLMQAILPDQSMCTAILKLANSAFFGRPRKVASIEDGHCRARFSRYPQHNPDPCDFQLIPEIKKYQQTRY